MAQLTYSAIASLDGYVADADGRFDWSMPDEEVHPFVNDMERPIGTYLSAAACTRCSPPWETPDALPDQSPVMLDFAGIWRSADKVVYSRTLSSVSTARTRIEREFDPEAVRALKTAAERDLSVGGPELAGHALRAGLVDECRLLLSPIVVGGGTPALPDGVRIELELLEERRFANGVVHLRYRVRS